MKKILILLILFSFNANATDFYGCFESKDYEHHIQNIHKLKEIKVKLEQAIKFLGFNPTKFLPEGIIKYHNFIDYVEISKCVNIADLEVNDVEVLESTKWGNEVVISITLFGGAEPVVLYGILED